MENESLVAPSEKPIGLSSDHAGYEMKLYVISLLKKAGIPYKDFGAFSNESVDYPDFGHPLAIAVENGEVYPGIAFCGTGNGINMVMNKHQQIRSCIAWTAEIARLCRQHNDANILTIPARFVTETQISEMLLAFLNTKFEGGRHQLRIDKIPCV